MKNLFIIIAVLCIIQCCCTDKLAEYVPIERCQELSTSMDSVNKFISGSWNWKEEKRLNRLTNNYEFQTPKSIGYSQTLVLRNDTAWFYKNHLLESIYRFRISYELEFTGILTDSLPVIVFSDLNTGMGNVYVPLAICQHQLLMMHQILSDAVGEKLWVRE